MAIVVSEPNLPRFVGTQFSQQRNPQVATAIANHVVDSANLASTPYTGGLA